MPVIVATIPKRVALVLETATAYTRFPRPRFCFALAGHCVEALVVIAPGEFVWGNSRFVHGVVFWNAFAVADTVNKSVHRRGKNKRNGISDGGYPGIFVGLCFPFGIGCYTCALKKILIECRNKNSIGGLND